MIRSLVLLGMLAGSAHADVELWTDVAVERDVTRRLSIAVDQQTRFDTDVSRLSALIPEIDAKVHVAKWLRVGAAYRVEYERDHDDEMTLRYRIDANVRAQLRRGRIRVAWETELQDKLRLGTPDPVRYTLRDTLSVEHHGRRWVPGAAIAVFHALDDGDAIHLDKWWLTTGCTRRLHHREVEVFYRLELPQADPGDPVLHIVGAGFRSDL